VAWKLALESGADTHGHPSGHLPAAYFAVVIHRLVHNDDLNAAMTVADAMLAMATSHEETARAVAAAREIAQAGLPSPDALESLGEGSVGEEALAIALACALTVEADNAEAVRSTLWRSVLHRGDSDSTGSLTGNISVVAFSPNSVANSRAVRPLSCQR
jgi:ADP-ribosylglycohydrolase